MTQVRRFRPDDVVALVTLFRDTIRRVNSRDYSPEQIRAWALDELDAASWVDRLASRTSLVAQLDGEIVGFGDLEADGHLDHFYVHADHQGRGVGRTLLVALESAAAQSAILRIFTEASITARPFFARLGYCVLQEQTVVCRGVEFINYRMEKYLHVADSSVGP